MTPDGIERETRKFRDHEFKEPKSDFKLAWYRWIRTAAEERLPRGGLGATTARDQERARVLQGLKGASFGQEQQQSGHGREVVDVEAHVVPDPKRDGTSE